MEELLFKLIASDFESSDEYLRYYDLETEFTLDTPDTTYEV